MYDSSIISLLKMMMIQVIKVTSLTIEMRFRGEKNYISTILISKVFSRMINYEIRITNIKRKQD